MLDIAMANSNNTICLFKSMAEQLAENYHNTWGRKKKMELQAKGLLMDSFIFHLFFSLILVVLF